MWRSAPPPRAAPPPFVPAEYIETGGTGNKVSRRAAIYGANNIVLGGKCVLHHGATIRGDLKRIVHATDAPQSSNVVVVVGRYGILGERCTVRPPYKTHHGCVAGVPRVLTTGAFPTSRSA